MVSEGFYALRMDALAAFLDTRGVRYRVAGPPPSPSALAALGGGAALSLALFFLLGTRKGS